MRFLANENFPLPSFDLLIENDCNIIHIGKWLPGISDREVIEFAMNENRTILTFDNDYGEIIFKYNLKPSSGIIYFRLGSYHPEEPANLLIDLINDSSLNFDNRITVVDKKSIRQRKYQ